MVSFDEQNVMLCTYKELQKILINIMFVILNNTTFIGAMSNVVEVYKTEKIIAFRNKRMGKFNKVWKIFTDQ